MLLAHPDSRTEGTFAPLHVPRGNSQWSVVQNAITVARAVRSMKPDIVHSFGRLIQLMSILPFRIPKLMSYQREPHLPGIARAARLSRKNSLLFSGCSDYITQQIATVAQAVTVYNGVPLDTFRFEPKVADDAPLVFLGRVEHIKGVHNAIAIAKRSGRQLIIAGNIPDDPLHQTYFRERVEPHLSGSVTYVGPVDDAQKRQLLGRAAALVMAIEWDEPFGIVMTEALACGTPVIGTPRGAVPEVVQHGINGFVDSSIESLADYVSKLPSIDRKRCLDTCVARFSETAILDRYEQVYASMTQPLSPSPSPRSGARGAKA